LTFFQKLYMHGSRGESFL